MRQIFLIAREFTSSGTALDPQTARFVETQRELHAEVHAELQTYGIVVRQRTSGIFPRANTPALGINLETAMRTTVPNFFHGLFPQIKSSDCVVIIRDGQNDLRGAITMYAHLHGIPVLALQLEPAGLHLPGDPLYELPHITNIRFHQFSEAKRSIRRFMNTIAARCAG